MFITGASSGLGEALAHAFYEQGCRVILAARRKEELERVKQELMKSHAVSIKIIYAERIFKWESIVILKF